ncbi:hypothetical protein [Rubricoccus marinus]|uniref:Uncharacterized protein n=1 Tax=Rubricoccus marinus TaxID=716817 RepID=A0A259TUR0_9BACT|nr:hypothetical protein [Rubricoccus marinus]OZC01288.1 hypothetical protein BSZ36_17730 [Rubricoccus marinus]
MAPSDDPHLRLLDGLAEAALRDDALADETHRGDGRDPEAVRAAGAAFIAPLLGRARLRSAAMAREATASRLTGMKEVAAAKLREARARGVDLVSALADLLGTPEGELQVHFRNVDHLDEADVADMLTEAELLRLLDEGEADE